MPAYFDHLTPPNGIKRATHLIVGYPRDDRASWRKGQAEAPWMVRTAAYIDMTLVQDGLHVTKKDLKHVWDDGDCYSVDGLRDAWAKTDRLFTIGGDHATTYDVLKAYGKPVNLVVFDAHSDCEPVDGDPDHASWVTAAYDEGLIVSAKHYGLRAPMTKEAHNIFVNLPGVEHKGVPWYITVDMDAFDPAHAPGVGYQEPGGMGYWDVRAEVDWHIRNHNVIGFDVCETLPAYDNPSGQTSRLAHRVMHDALRMSLLHS